MSMEKEKLIYDFANRQFHKAPINTVRDLMCICSDFANELLAQPLIDRLTPAEKEQLKKMYKRMVVDVENSDSYDCVPASDLDNAMESLESIFGKELFGEGEG